MLRIIKIESEYLWGSDGDLVAALVWDTETKKARALTNWGSSVHNGALYLSRYSVDEFPSFRDAVNAMRRRCERARPKL